MLDRLADPRGPIAFITWTAAIGLVIAGGVLTHAIQFHNWRLAQIASMGGLALLVLGVTLLITLLRAGIESAGPEGTFEETSQQKEKNRSNWLTRLVLVATFGMVVILIFAFQYQHWVAGSVASTIGVGFLAAGAAWLSGALVGFLFGIPHTRERDRGAKKTAVPVTSADETPNPPQFESPYQPSTSLEEISDWLTKIIVGVGLTQLAKIPGKLDTLAAYIAGGLGGEESAKAFALAIVIHFTVCGFLFGYLWARLYLLEAFRAADLLEKVEKISGQILDLRAKDAVENQLDTTKPKVPEAILKEAMKRASADTKELILERVKEARDEGPREKVADRTIPVLRALIDADTNQISHRNHAYLGYALQDMGKLDESAGALSKAIQIRDRLGRRGWSYYEFKRAIALIRKDTDDPSKKETRDPILADLKKAFPENSDKILKDKAILAWLLKNNITVEELQAEK